MRADVTLPVVCADVTPPVVCADVYLSVVGSDVILVSSVKYVTRHQMYESSFHPQCVYLDITMHSVAFHTSLSNLPICKSDLPAFAAAHSILTSPRSCVNYRSTA